MLRIATALSAAALFVSSIASFAGEALLDGKTLASVGVSDAAARIKAGTVVVLGEIHDQKAHHEHQVVFLNELAKSAANISVGFEFFYWPDQAKVDQFTSGALAEPDFLKAIEWGTGIPFDYYRQQALFPMNHHGYTIALNAPRALTAAIAKTGVAGLSAEQAALMPPGFTPGNAAYFERFAETMAGGHIPQDAIQRYFEAQSTWDDTMAYHAAEFLRAHPDQTLAIIVGDFHTAYGGGLPDRLRARGLEVTAISQVVTTGLSPEERQQLVAPDAKYGPRGEFVWITE